MDRQYLSTSLAHWRYVLNPDRAIVIQTIRKDFLQLIPVLMVFGTGWRFTMFIRKSCGVMFAKENVTRRY
jgi:hypothetical protein